MNTMLYKAGGDVKIWGMKLQIVIVDSDEIDNHIAEGWHLNPLDTQILIEKKPAKPKKKAADDDTKDEG